MSRLRELGELAGWLESVWADTGISTRGVADDDAPVGRVILDGREDGRTVIVMECMGKHRSQNRRCLMMMPRLVESSWIRRGQEDGHVRRSLGMHCVPGQTQTAGWVPRSVESSGLEKWQGKRMELRWSLRTFGYMERQVSRKYPGRWSAEAAVIKCV